IDILEYNVSESINTNILGTLNVVHACLENNVEKAVFVSTDKACSPVNTYGACKFVGEKIFVESNYSKGKKRTSFCCVRYGNVLESTGSVIPCFEEKILNNEKIPLTDSRMTRFIISHNEAADLIFKALKHSIGGEIFVPKLPSFKIVDLIQILKGKHNANTGVKVIGIRPGEKIHELMINESEVPRTFSFRNRYVITSSIQQYQQNLLKPLYQQEGRLLTHQDMNEYGSYSEVRPQQEIKELFEEFQLL
ncbi:TPA: polysaccharide biosynthesis protein, partial [Candidatus Woesearchaeota archaeon]|nr:polysaccharide biosynthesis protein [Candidatus Woesearchaeota archaeon]